MDVSQYLDMFIEESKEHLQACSEQLLALENNPDDLAIVNEVFRAAHTLKGMSATMGYEDIADLTHKMENVLDAIRNSKISVSTEILDVVFEAVDDLELMVQDIESGGDGKKDVSKLVDTLNRIEAGQPVDLTTEPVATTEEASIEVVTSTGIPYDEFELTVISQSAEQGFNALEITVTLRDDCLLKVARVFMTFEILEKSGEVIKTVPTVEQLENEDFDQKFTIVLLTQEDAEDLKAKVLKVSEIEDVHITHITDEYVQKYKQASLNNCDADSKVIETTIVPVAIATTTTEAPKETIKTKKATSSNSNKTIRVNIDRLDILMNLFEELVIDRGRLQSIASELHNPELNESVERMTRVSGDLQNIILNMRMVPVETVFNRFPKMVRQLARDLNKKVDLEIVGAETELDRTVIDEIGDPLVHLIRNALDHGIEMPEERIANGKPEIGTVTLRAYHSGNHVFIELEDDGAGVNRQRVVGKAIERGIVSPEAADSLTNKQVAELILASGFSTAASITDVSGRGVGLDVVKNTIESLGGHISIDSTEGKGSLFQVQLPLTLSIISVMLVELDEEIYAIPLSSIIETAIIQKSDILNAHNQPVIDFRGTIVPLVDLKDIFEMKNRSNEEEEFQSIVIVRKGDSLAGLVVDSFIGQQEIVLKSLGEYLQSVFAISGATILGNGQVALIVDCNALIK
ncbi:chemotaxis protein CheA [Sporosarcina sp. P21c]|uniref:chemotaxis protein CheA n=1 Tax=Sporosarcina TaxID=1569 RepID=UPI000A1514F2|nr:MULTISPECIES: chemotaxis protein CheA [Sporosarcina]ARJ40051.1 chemotaxis protein CheA [Sporosarcina ureae]PIC68753.1 chemotaxis protein CheA [Sporosarcina sp. P16a]PIC91065.1 chemotaxis protein CheA [Sporosarcina sp. P21c]PIC93805.1 chemotaxis protein CheA [Sporosarcina sp. P25]